MNARQFRTLFGINATMLCDRDDAKRWVNVVIQFHDFPYERVRKELFELIAVAGKDKPRLWYVEAVRRRILDKDHQEVKKAPVPPQMKEIMKGMFS